MANDSLPVVFKTKTYQNLVVVAFGAVGIAWGLYYVGGGVEGSVRVFNYGSVPASVAGTVFLAVGVLAIAGGLVSVVGGCPVLTIADGGITFKRCRGGTVRLAWTELVGIRTAYVPSPSPGSGLSGFDMLFLALKDGREINVGVGDETKTIEAVIRREAAKRGLAFQE